MDDLLFTERDLYAILEEAKRQARNDVASYPADKLVRTDERELCEYFVQIRRIEPLKLLKDKIVQEGAKEIDVDVSQDFHRAIHDRSRPFYIKGTAITIVVPFEGDPGLFSCHPSTYTQNPPRGRIKDQELRLTFARADQDVSAVQRDLQESFKAIEDYVSWANRDVEAFNAELPGLVKEHVRKRRDKLAADRKMSEGLGIPLRRRPDEAVQVVLPKTRRPFEVRRPEPAPPAEREAFLAIEEYDYILKIIQNMVAVMERSPKTFARMLEPELRDILLVILNAHYEGKATGETFNFEGKTDILIRHEGKNVFIAECKNWGGPKELLEGVSQVLKYVSWQDTKIALLVFNRDRNTSTVLEGVAQAMPTHPCFVKDLGRTGETAFRYIFHQPGDKKREVMLSVMVFDVPAA